MISIRENTFETNSSSTHSLTLLSDKEYKDWEANKAVWDEEEQCLREIGTLYGYCVSRIKELMEDERFYKEGYTYMLSRINKPTFERVVKELLAEHGTIDEYTEEDEELGFNLDGPFEDISDKDVVFQMLRCASYKWKTLQSFYDNDYYETFHYDREIEGVKVHAVGYYGHD